MACLFLEMSGKLAKKRAGCMACADEAFFCLVFLDNFVTKTKVSGHCGQEQTK